MRCSALLHEVKFLGKRLNSPRKHEFTHFFRAFIQFQSSRSLFSTRFRVRIIASFGFEWIFCFLAKSSIVFVRVVADFLRSSLKRRRGRGQLASFLFVNEVAATASAVNLALFNASGIIV